ncbi:MAG: tryptophan synthase subunit alpha [Actinobacteria bacterium]|nr:tryptophan synthase subunit alpha [Actinomycetota bacterium]
MKHSLKSEQTLINKGKYEILRKFEIAKKEGRSALICYYPFGFPDIPTSLDIINEISKQADLVEIGIPFTDPTADGKTIQNAYEIALKNGANINTFIENLNHLKLQCPGILMSYLNPVYQFGIEELSLRISKKGISGFIFPDLPLEEKVRHFNKINCKRLPINLLVSPNDSLLRAIKIAKETEGFVYLVSSLGVTGARDRFDKRIFNIAQEVKKSLDCYLAVGFGISNPEQVRELGSTFDGIIIGSALVSIIEYKKRSDNDFKELKDFLNKVKNNTYKIRA